MIVYGLLMLLLAVAMYLLSNYSIDRSHTIQQAIEHGAPDVKEQWSGQEYELFNSYLMALADDVDYPMSTSEKSNKIFKHFIQSALNDSVLEANNYIELNHLANLQGVLNKILNVYFDKDVKAKKYSDELAHLYGIQIKIALDMLKISFKIISPMQLQDPTYANKAQGLYYLRHGSSIYISHAIKSVVSSENLQNNKILLDYLEKYVSESLSYMGPELRESIKNKILKENIEDKHTKEVLHKIVSELNYVKK